MSGYSGVKTGVAAIRLRIRMFAIYAVVVWRLRVGAVVLFIYFPFHLEKSELLLYFLLDCHAL